MAVDISGAVRRKLKLANDLDSLREKNRSEYHKSNNESRFLKLFRKRTRVDFHDVKDDLITIEDVNRLSKEICRKSENLENQLKSLIRAFAKGPNHVDAFLTTDDPLRSLTGYLTGNDYKLQIYAAYCLTNITANDIKRGHYVAKSCAPYLIAFLGSQNDLMQDLSACALGNIAASNAENRDLLKTQGLLRPLVELFKVNCPAVTESAAYATIKICGGQDDVVDELFSLGIKPLLLKRLQNQDLNEVIVGELAWLLLFLTSNELHAKEMTETGVLKIVVGYLHKISSHDSILKNIYTVMPLMRILGDAMSNDGFYCFEFLDKELLLLTMKKYLNCKVAHIVKETMWTLCNIFTVNKEFATIAIEHDMLQAITDYFDWDYNIKTEVLRCICTLASYGGIYTDAIATKGILTALLRLNGKQNEEVMILSLQLIELLLRLNDQGIKLFEANNGKSYLEDLLNGDSNVIRNMANDLKKKYWN